MVRWFAGLGLLLLAGSTGVTPAAAGQAGVELHVLPRRVYVASDQARPRWRLILVAINREPTALLLEGVAVTAQGDHPWRRVQRGERIQGIVQGSRQMPQGQIVVVVIADDQRRQPLPTALVLELTFARQGGPQIVVARRVPLVPRSTSYLRFPLLGRWVTANGRAQHHCVGMNFGFDFVAEQDFPLHEQPPERKLALEDFTSYRQPLYAPCDGTIIACACDQPDLPPTPGVASYAEGPPEGKRELYPGNYIVMRAPERRYLLLAHFMRDSLLVKPGDQVREGQHLGRVGNSGNSSGPHLHIEMLDGAPELAKIGTLELRQSGMPFGFREVSCQRGQSQSSLRKAAVPEQGEVVSIKEEAAQ